MDEIVKGGEAQELSTDIHVITGEINAFRRTVEDAVLEIGCRLKHARIEIFGNTEDGKGRWNRWCEEELGFTRRTANRMIQSYDQFGNGTTSSRFGKGKIFEMLSLPSDVDRREFTIQPHTIPSTGETKTVDEMTVRELREVKKALKGERQLRQQAEQNYEGIRQAFESRGNQEPEVHYVEVPDRKSQEKVKRYEELFGDVSLYEGKTTRVTNGDAITYSVFEFTEDIRKFIEKYGHLTHFAREFNAMIDEGKSEYSNAVNDLYTFLKLLERNLNQKESVIIDQ